MANEDRTFKYAAGVVYSQRAPPPADATMRTPMTLLTRVPDCLRIDSGVYGVLLEFPG
ncbi:MAG: hypothetical protein WBC51_15390 [Vicinamibacterales bacterium]